MKHSDNAACSSCNHNHTSLFPTQEKVKLKNWILLGSSFASIILSFVFYRIDLYKGSLFTLLDPAWLAITICGYPIIKEGFSSLKNKKISSSVLITVALLASILMAFFTILKSKSLSDENYLFIAGEIAFLMALGELIEEITSGKSRAAIEKLISLNPQTASLKTQNGYINIDVCDIQVGNILLVRNDEIIPIDGILASESGLINQATLTGESQPKDVFSGEQVFASTKNIGQPIEIKATKKSNQTVLSQIIEYYKNAIEKKAPIANLADKLSSKLVPIALLVALFVFTLVTGIYNITEGLARGLAIIVVFCPCALVLATPTALAASIGNASKKGIFIKNGQSLEVLSKIDTIAFDKTGTLTTGSLEVDEIISFNWDNDKLLFYVASAEKQSNHPIAKAILNYYNQATVEPQHTRILAGIGIEATVEGKNVQITKISLAHNEYPEFAKARINVKQAKTILAVIIDDNAEGIIVLRDNIRDSAYHALSQLNQMGYETILLTGNNENMAKEVAEELNIQEYHYDLLPIDKAEIINQIRQNGKRVMMVGDGVNDAPAMSVSDVSISMGNMGNEVAIDASDISLFNDNISNIPTLLSLAQLSVKTIKINIILSIAINLVTVALSALGVLKAVWGALLHNVSSVLVSFNSALLLKKK